MTTIVYGPHACGKTINAMLLMRHFGCDGIVDDFTFHERPQPGALHLTNDLEFSTIDLYGGVSVVGFNELDIPGLVRPMTTQKAAASQPSINRITHEDVAMFRSGDNAMNAADLYQQIATKYAIYPGQGTPLGLAYIALKLNGEAGEIAEHVGKAMRDDDLMGTVGWVQPDGTSQSGPNDLTGERRALLRKEIGDVLWYASAACNELGISLSEAMTENLQKLCDRTDRGALRGSGDDR